MSLTITSSYQTLDYIAGRDRNQREAIPRPARVRFFVNVTNVGAGEVRMNGLSFGALILEEPTFSWGLTALDSLPADSVPLATACILGFITNDNGIYTGCNLGFRMSGSTAATYRYKFSLTFEGSTLRSVANTGMLINSESGFVGYTVFRS